MKDTIFEQFFNNTIEGIIIIQNGFIKNINKSMLDILKYKSKDEIIGNLATGILIPNISQKYLEYDNAIFEEVSLISKEGDIIPAIIKIEDIKYEKEVYKMVFILNLTELKEKESLLLEQSRMAAMGEMISMIAHQWKQPLSSISTAISTLKLRIKMNKYNANSFENKINDIENYLLYMSNTIDDFRNFFKTTKEKELISLNSIVNITLEMIEKPFKKRGINIIIQKSVLDPIFTYKNEILQVLLNILNNSNDAFKEKNIRKDKVIKIGYEDFDSFQKISIEDNAGGIPEEIISKIFDPYFSTKDEKNGTGLGLYMCKIIIEKHCNGKIYVSNRNEGVCFEIIIEK